MSGINTKGPLKSLIAGSFALSKFCLDNGSGIAFGYNQA